MKLTYKVKKLSALEKMQAIELKMDLVAKAGYRCFRCGEILGVSKPAQLCHKIPKHKHNIEKYSYEVIHHPLNMEVGCCDCNCYAMNGINKDELAKEIKEVLLENN